MAVTPAQHTDREPRASVRMCCQCLQRQSHSIPRKHVIARFLHTYPPGSTPEMLVKSYLSIISKPLDRSRFEGEE